MLGPGTEEEQSDMKNTLYYIAYLKEPPDESTLERYRVYLATFLDEIEVLKFNLEISKKARTLRGKCKFNQDFEEEWFVIYILYKMTEFDENLVIKVRDKYGDPLLVEAAEQLPEWIESRASKNRSFIHRGALHIIPEKVNLKLIRANKGEKCSISKQAADFVRQINAKNGVGMRDLYQGDLVGNVTTLASEKVQKVIAEQLDSLPDKKAWLSRKFAQLDEIITDRVGQGVVSDGGDDGGGTSSSATEAANDKVQVEQKLEDNFKENLTLASLKAMRDEDFDISPISSIASVSLSTGPVLSSSSSSSWLSEQEEDDDDDNNDGNHDGKQERQNQ